MTFKGFILTPILTPGSEQLLRHLRGDIPTRNDYEILKNIRERYPSLTDEMIYHRLLHYPGV